MTLSRDTVGRIKTKGEVLDGVARTRCYEYDDAGRLVRVFDGHTGATCSGALLEEYRYDGNSNRVYAMNSAGLVEETDIVVDAQDRLLQYGTLHFTYEGNGELDTKEDLATGDAWDYDYDVMGNLVRVVTPVGDIIEYVTDARHRRVGKRVNGVLVQGFLYGDQLDPIAELDGAGNVVSRFVYGSRGHVPDFMVRGGVTYRIISDQLGSVVAVVNVSNGQLMQQREYDAWGRIVSETTAAGFSQPFGFAGGIWDADAGLVRFGARDYDPAGGRWTATDPIRFDAGDTILYGYSFADPVNSVDPSGLNPGDAFPSPRKAAEDFCSIYGPRGFTDGEYQTGVYRVCVPIPDPSGSNRQVCWYTYRDPGRPGTSHSTPSFSFPEDVTHCHTHPRDSLCKPSRTDRKTCRHDTCVVCYGEQACLYKKEDDYGI